MRASLLATGFEKESPRDWYTLGAGAFCSRLFVQARCSYLCECVRLSFAGGFRLWFGLMCVLVISQANE